MSKLTEMSSNNRDAFDTSSVAAVDATRLLVIEIHSAFTLVQLRVISIIMSSVDAGSVAHTQAVAGIHDVSSAMSKLSHDAIEAVRVFRELALTAKKTYASGSKT